MLDYGYLHLFIPREELGLTHTEYEELMCLNRTDRGIDDVKSETQGVGSGVTPKVSPESSEEVLDECDDLEDLDYLSDQFYEDGLEDL